MSTLGKQMDSKSSNDDNTPLWKYATKFGKTPRGGGNWEWKCHFCYEIYKSSYSTVKGHLKKILLFGIKPCKFAKQEHLLETRRVIFHCLHRPLQPPPKLQRREEVEGTL